MRSVRRVYIYVLVLVSLEILIWGTTGLLRTLTHLDGLVGGSTQIARGLALTLVGLPVFFVHWGMARRDAGRDSEEASSRLRALFLYASLLITLIPIIQNGLSLVDHLFFTLFGLDPSLTLIGQGQTWSDNLIAMLVNGVAALYLYTVLYSDWRALGSGEQAAHLEDTRRLYRYIWMIYGLGLTVFGVQRLILYLTQNPIGFGGSPAAPLASGLALLVTGVPLWVWTLQRTDELLLAASERESLLRRVILYLLALAGVGSVLTSTGLALALILQRVFGEAGTVNALVSQVGGSLSVAVPLGGVWAYYGHRLNQDVRRVADTPRRASLRRLYHYVLAFFGLVATVAGMRMLLGFVLQVTLGSGPGLDAQRELLANGLASIAVGLPLWFLTWGPMQAEAASSSDTGEHARRSIIRKAYLYLVLFVGVVSSMVSIGRLLYELFIGLFGTRSADFVLYTSDLLATACLLVAWTWVHLRALRLDNRKAEKALVARHAAFPTILFERDDSLLGEEVVAALRRQAPQIPVVVQKIGQGVPGEEMSGARVVVIPAGLAAQPPEALRIWLQSFKGLRLVVPEIVENWHWLGATPANRTQQGNQIALAIRQMAEGQSVRAPAPANPWVIVGYIFAVLFGLEIVFVGLMLLFGSG